MTSPELSVIVAARNAAATISPLLDALLDQQWDGSHEVVVVDNRSTDATAELVRSVAARDARVRLVRAHNGIGIAYAKNAGVAGAAGRNLAFCDSDDMVADGWLQAIGGALRKHLVVVGRLDVDLLNPPWLAGARGRAISKGMLMWQGVVPCIWGGNFGIDRSVMQKVRGFDESFMTGSDIEFSMRLWKRGLAPKYVAEAVVFYRFKDSTGALWAQGRRFGSAQVRLWRRLDELTLPTPNSYRGWRAWLWLARRFFSSMRTKEGRIRWLWTAANKVGQLEGSIRFRTLHL